METNTTTVETPAVVTAPTEAPASLLSQTEPQTPVTPVATPETPVESPIQPSTFDMNTVINPDGTFKVTDWYKQIDPSLADSKTLERFKNIQTVAKSLDHAESLVSKKVIQPKDMDEATSKQYYEELGVPNSAEEYGFVPPANLPDNVQYDDSNDKWFAEFAKEKNIPKDVATELKDAYSQRQESDISLNNQKSAEADARYLVDNENALNLKFPNKTHEVLAGAKRFLDAYGMTDSINGTPLASNAEFLEQMYNNSIAMGEDKLVDAVQATGNSDTGSENKAKLQSITENPAYVDKKHPDHPRLVREFEALMLMIHS